MHPKKPEPKSPQKSPGKIGKLQVNLGINPAALLPGAAPPNREPENVAIGFDLPAEANTLHSANKDRAKIISRRRPPSRRGRQASAAKTSDDFPDMSIAPSSPPDKQKVPDISERVPKPTSDLFGNDDMLDDEPVITNPIKTVNPKDDFSDGLFSKIAKIETKSSAINDDLFGDLGSTSKTKSEVKKEKEDLPSSDSKKSKTSAISLDDDEDIFSTKPKAKPKEKTIFDDDNDIFSSSIPNTAKSKGAPAKKEEVTTTTTNPSSLVKPVENSLNDSTKKAESESKKDEAADDDIFGTSSVKKNETLDDDDIFTSSSKKDKKKTKKVVTKDEDLFKDDTDIFADIPTAKPKEKKKKKSHNGSISNQKYI